MSEATATTGHTWRCGAHALEVGRRTRIMAIVNVTPDSFSGDGLEGRTQMAIERGLDAAERGADIVDVGGESTRPHAPPVEEDEERARVLPVVRTLARQLRIPISVDTSKPGVAAAALDAGASIVNDVSGLALGDESARVAARHGAGLIVMRFPGFPRNEPRARAPGSADLISVVLRDLEVSVRRALDAGVRHDALAVDPGFGFGIVPEDSIELLRHVHELRALPYPLVVGVSRKGFTGRPDHLPVAQRQWGTAAAHALAIAGGADVLRAHDVQATVRVARFTDLVVRA